LDFKIKISKNLNFLMEYCSNIPSVQLIQFDENTKLQDCHWCKDRFATHKIVGFNLICVPCMFSHRERGVQKVTCDRCSKTFGFFVYGEDPTSTRIIICGSCKTKVLEEAVIMQEKLIKRSMELVTKTVEKKRKISDEAMAALKNELK
jgi:uncharacterized CHY-type Zn-finger protein